MPRGYIRAAALAALACVLAACGAGAISDADQIATRVAQDRAVSQTLTAEAPTAAPTGVPTAQATPAATDLPAPSDTPLTATDLPAPTHTPAPTDTSPPTDTPAPPPPPTDTPVPTATEERVALSVFAPGGTANGLYGQLGVLGGGQYDPDTRIVPVRVGFAVRVEASDPERGAGDGAGIVQVTLRITNQQSGNLVYEHSELNVPYCLFGDSDGQCLILPLRPGVSWPGGAALEPGQHFVEIEVQAENEQRTEFWNFIADLQLS